MNSYTEDEAKGKWCPFARAVVAVSETTQGLPPQYKAMASGNRFLNGTISPCIGSGCMAWRWALPRSIESAETEAGYCGLAGRPS